jgi:ABC-2 type transport system ATP-binding protein
MVDAHWMIETEGLTRRYGRTVAVEDLDLRVGQGEMYGFLGANGAGKTTTLSLLLGMERPTRGTVSLFGALQRGRSTATMARIGVAAEQPRLYEEMTARDYLAFFARLYDVPGAAARIAALLEALDLGERAGDRLGGFSSGMAQKVNLARALLHQPELLILDEPVAHLDPEGIKQVRDLVAAENRRGVTVLVSSHLLSEVERTCHRVGIMQRGRLVAEGTLGELRARLAPHNRLALEVDRPAAVRGALESLPFVREVAIQGTIFMLTLDGGADYRAAVSQAAVAAGATVLSMELRETSLEDAFLAAVSRAGTVGGAREGA